MPSDAGKRAKAPLCKGGFFTADLIYIMKKERKISLLYFLYSRSGFSPALLPCLFLKSAVKQLQHFLICTVENPSEHKGPEDHSQRPEEIIFHREPV